MLEEIAGLQQVAKNGYVANLTIGHFGRVDRAKEILTRATQGGEHAE